MNTQFQRPRAVVDLNQALRARQFLPVALTIVSPWTWFRSRQIDEPTFPVSEDVFISYSNKNRAKAARLARQLIARGYSVWWAAHLIPAGLYRAEIDAKLNAAKAVIVIWSDDSVQSDWVMAEAEHGYRQDKLVNVHMPDIKRPERALPKPFCVRHSARIADIMSILAALDIMGVPHDGSPTVSTPRRSATRKL